MTDFSHIQSLDVSVDKTTRYTITQITSHDISPTLILAPATDVNKPLFNAILKRSKKNSKAARAGSIGIDTLSENRDEDRLLYSRHVVKGWEDMLDAKGKEVVFSPDVCKEFLEALPNWIFDDLRNFASSPISFVEDDDEILVPEEKAKN